MIVEQARTLHGPWPSGMTLFVFDDAYGWTASISRPTSERDNFYRTCTLDLVMLLKSSMIWTHLASEPTMIFSQICIQFRRHHQT
jgi:hypothetical protein